MQETQYTPEEEKERTKLRKQLHREFFSDKTDEAVEEKMDGRLAELEKANHELVRRVKLGWNDLCPCGSGKKFKACCISKVGERVAVPEGKNDA